MNPKVFLLLIRRIYYQLVRANIILGKKLNIHPFAKIVAYGDSKIEISDSCAIAGSGIINAENGEKFF